MQEVVIHEVGLRDGLQMEKTVVPLEQKVVWIKSLAAAGVDAIQAGSFVHPVKVPQMADTDELFRIINAHRGEFGNVVFSGLVLNEKGLERGLACGVGTFCMGVSASETHSMKNTGMGIPEATKRIIATAKEAIANATTVQVSVQSAFGCGFEGPVAHEQVLTIIREYLNAGLTRISLADTAGHASPRDVEELFGKVLALDPTIETACHFHNTYGMGIANCYAALKVGVRNFESSVAGLGGCPFTKIAGGNVCTEDFVHMLHKMRLRDDVSLERLTSCARGVADFFGRDLPGTMYKMM